jgi:hypothetical protein
LHVIIKCTCFLIKVILLAINIKIIIWIKIIITKIITDKAWGHLPQTPKLAQIAAAACPRKAINGCATIAKTKCLLRDY